MPPENRYLASLLIRLSRPDSEANGNSGPLLQTKRQWISTLLNEIEDLLNTKRAMNEVPETYRLAAESILVYGVPDCMEMSIHDPQTHKRLAAAIEVTLRRFESRLTAVRVRSEPSDNNLYAVRFVVEALVRLSPETEPIRFETLMKSDRSQFVVRHGS